MDTNNTEEENSTPEELKCYIFMKYDNFVKVIENGHLKLVLPSETNDPYEFRPITPDEPEEKRKEAIKQYDNEISEYGFLSFSSNPYSSVMWAHYSENHKGVCLEFTFKLEKSESSLDGKTKIYFIESLINDFLKFLSAIYDIYYSDKRPESGYKGIADQQSRYKRNSNTDTSSLLSEHNRAMTYFATKGTEWEYENEKRIIISLDPNSFKEHKHMHGNNYFVNYYNKYITKVILGIKCPFEEWRIQHMLKQYQTTNGYEEIPKVVRAQFSADDYKVVVPD